MFIVVFPSLLAAQTVYRYSVRPIGFSARGLALAETNVADAREVNSIMWNPATLAFPEDFFATANFSWERDVAATSVIIPHRIGPDHTVAVGIMGGSFGQQWETPYFTFYGLDAGYAFNLLHSLGVGILVSSRYGETEKSHLWTSFASIGVFYAPSPEVRYGLSYESVGAGIDYVFDGYSSTLRYEHQLPKTIRIGSGMSFPSWLRRPVLNINIVSAKTIDEYGLLYGIGIEFVAHDHIQLRVGYLSVPASNPREETGLRCGLGVKGGFLNFDYGIFPGGNQQHHQLTVSIPVSK